MMLRPATLTDATAIADLWNPYIRDTTITFTTLEKTPAEIAAMISEKSAKNHPYILAISGETLLGFATYGQFRPGPGYALTMEHSIILSPNATRSGIGQNLMTALEKHARANGVHSLIGGISAQNQAAIAFHIACSFEIIATLPKVGWKFEQLLDLVLLQKIL